MRATPTTPDLDRLEHRWVGPALRPRGAGGALLQPAEAVVDQDVAARHLDLELDHRRATGRHQRGLDVGQRLAGALRVDPVEDLADDVEAGGQVRTADAEEDADRLADLGLEGVVAGQRADATVEDARSPGRSSSILSIEKPRRPSSPRWPCR